ncbi:transposable element Tcb1 transposase [Trichonephila clavipes]|nr:transposable element Tcb1 transposase [Trichonephila clavipes]
MLQDYDTSFSRLYFSQPRFSSPPLSLSPVPTFSPLSLPDPSLYIVSRSTCCQNYLTRFEEEYANYRKPPDGADSVRHNDESVREGYIRNAGKESVISRLWQRFQDDGNVSRCYSTGRLRVTTLNEGRYLAVTAKINRQGTSSDLSRQLSLATGTTVSRQTVYRRLGHISLYARRPVRGVQLTTTHCRLRLTWSREQALWTPQQCSCVMFSDESRFTLQSDSRRTLIRRAPGTRYHQENTIERHRYGGAGWLVWGGIILGSRNDLHVQSVTMTGHIYRDVILEQHARLFWGAICAEFLFMDDNARPQRASIVDECLQSEDITRMDWTAYSPDLNPIEHVWDMLGRRIAAHQPSHLSTGTSEGIA